MMNIFSEPLNILIISLKNGNFYFPYNIHNIYHMFGLFCRIIKIRPVLSIMGKKLTPREVESLPMTSAL